MSDPIRSDLQVNLPVEATARCAPPPLVALAATNGPWSLPEEVKEHLLNEDCPVCAQALTDAWVRHCPPGAVLDARAEFSPEGSFGHVLALHVEVCDRAACLAASTSLVAAEAPVLARPEGLEGTRWKVVAERLGGWVTDSFAWSFGAEMALRSRGGDRVRPRTFLGGDVLVEASDRDPERTSVWIAESAFAVNALVFILQAPDGHVLIEHVFADAGESPGEFPVPPSLATGDGVAVFTAPIARGSSAAQPAQVIAFPRVMINVAWEAVAGGPVPLEPVPGEATLGSDYAVAGIDLTGWVLMVTPAGPPEAILSVEVELHPPTGVPAKLPALLAIRDADGTLRRFTALDDRLVARLESWSGSGGPTAAVAAEIVVLDDDPG